MIVLYSCLKDRKDKGKKTSEKEKFETEPSFIEGEVEVGKLAVEPGATFNASCVMKGSEKKSEVLKESLNENIKSQNHPFDRAQRIQKPKTEQQN